MAQLTIVFDGAIAVGPPDPGRGSGPGPFFGIMPRSARRVSHRTEWLRRNGRTAETQFTAAHIPTVFTLLKPAAGSRRPDRIVQLSPVHERWYLWHPVRERLEFRFSDGRDGLEYLQEPASRGLRRLAEDSVSFHGIQHVPDMDRIWPERNVLLEGMLDPGPGVSERVATQVFVPRGAVVAAGALRSDAPEDVDFEPPRKSRTERLVPNAAMIVDTTSVEIATFSLDSGDPLHSIKLEMADEAEIWVSNGDPSDVEIDMEKLAMQIAVRLAREGKEKPEREAAEHFDLLARALGRDRADAALRRMVFEFHHHGRDRIHQGVAREVRRTGEHDIDFELFYSLLEEDADARDDALPIPKHRRGPEAGPDCYCCIVKPRPKP